MECSTIIDFTATMAVPTLFGLALLLAPNGIWKMGAKLKSNDKIRQSMVSAQQVETAKIVDKFVTGLEAGELEKTFTSYQFQKVQSAISYTINRHDWYEAQRSGLITKHLTLSGLVFTAIGLYVGQQKAGLPFDAKLIIFSVGLLLLISLLNAIHLYNSELDQDRPYRLVSDIRFWYYRYSLPENVKDYRGIIDFESMAKDVLNERKMFFDRAIDKSSLESTLREDFEQLFILHVLVKHKSESLQKIRWTFFLTAVFLASSSVWFFLYFGFLK